MRGEENEEKGLDSHAVRVLRPEALHIRQYVLQTGGRQRSGTGTVAEGGRQERKGSLTRGCVVGK